MTAAIARIASSGSRMKRRVPRVGALAAAVAVFGFLVLILVVLRNR